MPCPEVRHDPDPQPSSSADKSGQTLNTIPPSLPAAPPTYEGTLQTDGSPLRPTAEDHTLNIPGYEILGELGHGGMGVVYQARQLKANRVVALKMILAGRHGGLEEKVRFQIEAEAVARLIHPHIVQLHEVGEHDGLPFFSLEFCAGGSLDRKLKTWTPTAREAAALLEELARAMHFAHLRGVVHRDLKPANVLLTASGAPKVTDFGLAKQLDSGSDVSKSGAIMGTPSYMAPEQAAGKVHDTGPAADVYALGSLLYELLCGQPPFRGATAFDTIQQVLTQEPLPPSKRRPGAPRDLETICLKCLPKDPERRYPSAEDLADDVRRWQAGEPIAARPVGRGERLLKWIKRRPAAAALGTMAALAGVVLLVVVFAKLRETEAALADRDRADRERAVARVTAPIEAAPGAVPGILAELEMSREEVLQRLRDHWQTADRARRTRAGLALVQVEPDVVRDALAEGLPTEKEPTELLLIRDALKPHAAELREQLWAMATDEKAEAKARLRCLTALAAFDADNPRWQKQADVAVTQMLADPFYLATWMQGLKPVANALLTPLAKVYRDSKTSPEGRELAATVLADYAAENLELLADLLLDADPKQYAILFPVVDRQRQAALERMRQELTKVANAWPDAPLDPAWTAAPQELREEIERAEGLFADRWALCQALPLERVAAVTEGLRRSGYRPVRVRPWVDPASRAGSGRGREPSGPAEVRLGSADLPAAAIVWTRDGRDWKLETDLSPANVTERDALQQKAGFVPVDVAGRATRDGNRYAVLWVKARAGERAGLYVEAGDDADHKERYQIYHKDGFEPATLSSWKDAHGALRYASVWIKGVSRQGNATWRGDEDNHAGSVVAGEKLLVDVSLSPPADPGLRETRHPVQLCGAALLQREALGLAAALTVLLPEPARSQYAAVWCSDLSREAEGLQGMTAEAHLTRCRELVGQGYRPVALGMTLLDGGRVAASAWHRPVPKRDDREQLARRQATGAITLLKMAPTEEAWKVYRHHPDPEARSQLVWRGGLLGLDPKLLVQRLDEEKDVSAQRALILGLGEFTEKELPASVRGPLVTKLLSMYREHPDAGIHGAIDWLLRQNKEGDDKRLLDWGQAAELARIDEELKKRATARASPVASAPGETPRLWYVNGQGQTLVKIPGPVEFRIGAPLSDPERFPAEKAALRRIPRHFAIGSRHVTVAEYQRFLKERPDVPSDFVTRYSPDPNGPILAVSWFAAAQYCNWLSEQEGLDEQEWCYPKHANIKDGMKLERDYLNRTGYRLPTEAEWEYACRAGADTSRYYGSSLELLPRYAWFLSNTPDRSRPVGQKRPNDLGLFDMHGNVWNWTPDPFFYHAQGKKGRAAVDEADLYGEDIMTISDSKSSRVLRGGSFYVHATYVRASTRNYCRPSERNDFSGLRLARTYR